MYKMLSCVQNVVLCTMYTLCSLNTELYENVVYVCTFIGLGINVIEMKIGYVAIVGNHPNVSSSVAMSDD